jgi:hypothetical protein
MVGGGDSRKVAPDETRPQRGGGPETPLRRTAARSFSLATKQWRFQEVEGRCEACGELLDGLRAKLAGPTRAGTFSEIQIAEIRSTVSGKSG